MEATLLDLAREAGFQVRRVPTGADGDGVTTSGVCHVQGSVFVVLVAAEPAAFRIDALARALREYASPFVESRWLPPAVRERLSPPA